MTRVLLAPDKFKGTLSPDQARGAGFGAVYALQDECGPPGEALAAPGPLLRVIGARLARQFRPQRGRP